MFKAIGKLFGKTQDDKNSVDNKSLRELELEAKVEEQKAIIEELGEVIDDLELLNGAKDEGLVALQRERLKERELLTALTIATVATFGGDIVLPRGTVEAVQNDPDIGFKTEGVEDGVRVYLYRADPNAGELCPSCDTPSDCDGSCDPEETDDEPCEAGCDCDGK